EHKERRRFGVKALTVVLLAGLAGRGAAADFSSLDSSVKLVPANAAFYSSMLRNREQIETIAKSKAWAKLMTMPGVQMARMAIQAQMANPQFAQFLQLYQTPENQELARVLSDMVSNEV